MQRERIVALTEKPEVLHSSHAHHGLSPGGNSTQEIFSHQPHHSEGSDRPYSSESPMIIRVGTTIAAISWSDA